MQKIFKIINFFSDVKLELKKVNWPTRREVIMLTLMVIGASLVVAIILGSLDFVFQLLLDRFVIS